MTPSVLSSQSHRAAQSRLDAQPSKATADGKPQADLGPHQVVIASTQRGWRGGETQAALLAEGLRTRGHRCSILVRRDGEFAARMAAADFEVGTFVGSGRSPLGIWQIRRALRRLRPDLVIFNDAHALTGGGLALAGLPGAARIALRRVDFPIRSPGRYRRWCDRVVCVSQQVAEVCRDGGIPADKLAVVYDGVDPGRVRSGERERGRRALGLADQQPLLLTVAALTDHKGHTYLLDAMPAVVERYPNVCLALAGDGELAEPLQEQAGQLGLNGNVRFLGYRDDVADLMMAADLFVLPSKLEGLGSSLIDAMLAERPIVATTAGGIPELVGPLGPQDEQVAWLVPPRDPPALAAAILNSLASADKGASLATRAVRRAERMFTAEQMVQATLEVFRDIRASKAA